jgi:prepilin-type N-terminal cleavage/methylation domain-containing protein|tara:strand:+ start:320 stop:820 length:501 start_codon:yes stop_codon:yes gene_type:complete
MNTLPSIGLLIRIKKNMGHLKHSQGGFTLIELIIVTVLLAFIIPSATMLISRALSSYEIMWTQNTVSKSANFALNRFTDNINNLASIESAEDDKIIFVNRIGTRVTYQLANSRLRFCIGSCDSPDDFGDLARNVITEGGAHNMRVRWTGIGEAELAGMIGLDCSSV